MACEIIVDTIGENDFGELIADEYRRPGYSPSEIHKIIYSLDSRLVITPNIDKIYEHYASAESHSTVVVKSYLDEDLAKFLRTKDYLIIRAHGHVDDPSKIIFTHKQYSAARNKYSTFYKLLDALILTHTFIFLGCGINDPDIQLTLENQNFLYPGCRPHYFIIPKNSHPVEFMNVLANNRNIKFLPYDPIDENHTGLYSILRQLNEEVERERMDIAANQTW